MSFLLVLLLAVSQGPTADQLIGKPLGAPLSGEALQKRTEEVSALLRCPVCQGMSVADSPAVMAVNMKNQVRELLSWGYSEEQIIGYFERSYGQFVRLEPPRRGINWVVWLGPFLALILGATFIAATMRRKKGNTSGPPVVDAGLESYVTRVRELSGEEQPR